MDSHRIGLCVLLLCSLNGWTTGFRVLIMCPAPVMSHHGLCRSAANILQEYGHQVALISPFPKQNSTIQEIGVDMTTLQNMLRDTIKPGKSFELSAMKKTSQLFELMSEAVMTNQEVQSIIKEKFDVYILEYYMNDNLLGVGVKLNCPTVLLSSLSMIQTVAVATRNPISPEMLPNFLTSYSASMNLWQRLINSGLAMLFEALSGLFSEAKHQSIYEKWFPEEAKLVPYSEVSKRISLVLINSHPSIGVIRPLLPNAVEIGGYHIGNPEELSPELQKIMDSSKHGVIYFSLGSTAEGRSISDEHKMIILKTLGNLKQTVLWKFEDEIEDAPKNMIIRKWFAQTSVLSHPKLKLFITQGGLLSCTEATHFNVPMLMIPLLGDQYHNARVYTERGQALTLSYENITEESLNWAVNEVLNNQKYAENTLRYHKIYHDRPIRARELMVHQVEHVIRTGGAPHLTPPPLPRSSQLLLDVIAVVLIPLHIAVFLCIYITKKLIRKIFSSSEKLKQS